MKLNIIVVITTWLPLLDCRYAGIYAQAAPNKTAPNVANNQTIGTGRKLKFIATKKTPSPPIYACPSPPILKSLQWNATAKASPVKIKFVV